MHRWITRLFILTTFGPVLVWAGCAGAVLWLSGPAGCRIDEAGVYPCTVLGRDIGETAAMMGVLAAWGPLLFGPAVLVSGGAWALYTVIRRLRRWR
ncbi:MAG: hypothetical protein K8F31_10870 [Roseovarius sp.]|nr:hypothetical protein [Roseovarius sp.]